MNCPTCNASMHMDRTGVEHANNGVTYDQVFYHCTNDDTWVTVETPQETEE